MRYAIFSTNPNFSQEPYVQEPYVFTSEVAENGVERPIWKPAVYATLEEAKMVCHRMNENELRFPFEVRDVKTRERV